MVMPAGGALAADKKPSLVTLDKLICTLGNSAVTLEQIEVERTLLAHSRDSLLFPGREESLGVEEIFLELFTRNLLRFQTVRMGFTDVDPKAVDAAVEATRRSFGSEAEYRKFLIKFQLNDESIEGLVPNGEVFADIRGRFRTTVMVHQFVDKKLDLQVRLATQDALAQQGFDPATSDPNSDDEAVKTVREQIRQQKLREWIRDLAARTTITITDENYRPAINAFLSAR
ncbi:MAG: hypothetical protein IT350_08800 [Deltaproteobacteria bacterium]|nr:hypothetical protein [Deltaproteobacteria bacterium]